ncbi:abortive phage infection domain-containing protein [Rhizobium sp. CIAT894]|uniref:abortive infection family protein n=1 Tax=Rhizobium sp. CIAT894 TaxID=2020312 RepID=UPI000A1F5F87|nr:abortive infection family protein [Rhizobium sp. CIAT894]ARM88445.1 abortive phage infection domain-containing protein [Rhizobium sp. CIAT894]
MSYIAEGYEEYLSTVAELLIAEGMTEAASVLRLSTPKVEETGYDNWNGGTSIWTIYLRVEPVSYAQLGASREALEEQINNRLKSVLEQFSDGWVSIKIVPLVKPRADWPEIEGGISRVIRQNIFDGLRIDNVVWSGRLEEVEFLERLFDLKTLPSTDSRYSDASGDIWQHRVNNPQDWDDDWIYADQRFNLLQCPADQFLRFLSEIVHPVVRPDRNESLKIVQQFNDQLRLEGWHLVEDEKIAGRPRFIGRRIRNSNHRSVTRARSAADALDAGWMQKEIERLENAVERDPALAIGTAKELVETCCKTILGKRGVEISRGDDLPKLTKALAKELKLVPEGISDEAKGANSIRLILQNLSSMTQNLAELRGLYGSGHGRDGKHRGLEPRHARLAVGAAAAFIDFVTETYHRRTEIEKQETSRDV